MDGFAAREHAAEAFFVQDFDNQFVTRRRRVEHLGAWAAKAMNVPTDAAKRYRDLLYRIAISSFDDHVLIDRVRGDLAAAGVKVTRQRVGEILNREDH